MIVSLKLNVKMDIDFVLIWVDGSDEKWIQKKAIYGDNSREDNNVRFRDWDILKYWFRAVNNFAPWVHKIFVVTDCQCPEWLDTSHPKIELVDHQDYIPQIFLPTFNSNCIEANFHKIKGLSEYFVAFNDDMFINQPITPEYYFYKGKPCASTLEHIFDGCAYSTKDGDWGISMTDWMNTQVLNAHFNRLEVARKNPRAWYGSYLSLKYQIQAIILKLFHRKEFQHFYTPHNEKAFLKSTFEKVWKLEPNLLNQTCSRFRTMSNLNIYLMRYWQLAENNFHPIEELSKKKVLQLHQGCIFQLERMLFDPNITSLCLNDSSDCTYNDYQALKPQVIQLFERKFPQKCSFEL